VRLTSSTYCRRAAGGHPCAAPLLLRPEEHSRRQASLGAVLLDSRHAAAHAHDCGRGGQAVACVRPSGPSHRCCRTGGHSRAALSCHAWPADQRRAKQMRAVLPLVTSCAIPAHVFIWLCHSHEPSTAVAIGLHLSSLPVKYVKGGVC
jgi:hypothetical protein